MMGPSTLQVMTAHAHGSEWEEGRETTHLQQGWCGQGEQHLSICGPHVTVCLPDIVDTIHLVPFGCSACLAILLLPRPISLDLNTEALLLLHNRDRGT